MWRKGDLRSWYAGRGGGPETDTGGAGETKANTFHQRCCVTQYLSTHRSVQFP